MTLQVKQQHSWDLYSIKYNFLLNWIDIDNNIWSKPVSIFNLEYEKIIDAI